MKTEFAWQCLLCLFSLFGSGTALADPATEARSFYTALAERTHLFDDVIQHSNLYDVGLDWWWACILPFDLNGDGLQDALYTHCDSEMLWEVSVRGTDGWTFPTNTTDCISIGKSVKNGRSEGFYPHEWFVLEETDCDSRLCGILVTTAGDDASVPAGTIVREDVRTVFADGSNVVHETVVCGGTEGVLRDDCFRSIQRILAFEFHGTNLVAEATSWRLHELTNLPPSSLKTSLSLAAEERTCLLSALAAEGTTNAATCIVCDADGDGDTDAYLSIRGGLMATNSSDWTLWLQSSNEWCRAEVPVQNKGLGPFLDPDRPGRFLPSFDDDIRSVLPSVHASASDFYRVYRPDGTTWPAVFPRAPDGTLPEEFHRLFEVGAAFMRLERILPEPLVRPEGGNANALE